MNEAVAQAAEVDLGLDIDGDADQYLTFMMADEEYGVDILRVQEIRGWEHVTPVPNTPKYIKGVINLRGTIVPLVDLRERFGVEPIPYGPTTVVIVLKVIGEDSERIMGIVVDAVADVYNIEEENIKPAPDFGSVVSIEYVRGLASIDEKMLIVLEIDRLLSAEQLQEMAES